MANSALNVESFGSELTSALLATLTGGLDAESLARWRAGLFGTSGIAGAAVLR